MIASSVQLCPLEDSNSDSDYDEDDVQEYGEDLPGHVLCHEDKAIAFILSLRVIPKCSHKLET